MVHLLIAWWFSMAMLVITRWYISGYSHIPCGYNQMDIYYYNHIISTSFPLFCLVESVESPFFMVNSWHLPLSIAKNKGRCCCGTRRRTPSRQAIQTWCPTPAFAIGAEVWNSLRMERINLWKSMNIIAWTFNVYQWFSPSLALSLKTCVTKHIHTIPLSLSR